MMVEYKLTEKFNQSVIDELLEIQKSKGLTPEEIVESAKSKKSSLHNLFDWEDSVASEKWRLHQARVLVNEVRVVIEEKEYYAFENVSIRIESSKKDGKESSIEYIREYKPVVEILSNESLRKQIINSALNHLSYWEKQNEKYSELQPIISVAQKVRKQIERKWQKKKK